MDRRSNRQLGEYGERLACRFLTDIGFTIIERNWRCARGEIDIVATEGDCLVVCEVKTRRSEAFGAPFEAVTRSKASRLRRLAGLWLADAGPDRRGAASDLRIDVVSVLRPADGPARVEHLRGVA
jgi:putative endonuclease